MRRWKIILISLLTALALVFGGVGEALIRPSHRGIGDPPKNLPVESVKITTSGNDFISGWFIPGKPTRGAVLLLHGVRANRRDMLGRATFLNRLGYSVLLIDLPAHGESTGVHITYGLNEAKGVTAALQYLRQQLPHEKVGVIGLSLGAASLVLSKPDPAPSGVILESMFPTIREAISDRLEIYLGRTGPLLAPMLLWQLPLRLGISPDQLRPIADIAFLKSPVLIISGALDLRTTLPETKRIYAAANLPKELWIIEGAGHIDLYRFKPTEYEIKVSAFFAKCLRNEG